MTATPFKLLQLLCAGPSDPRPPARAVIVAAHPDDESIGAGARRHALPACHFVFTTDGAPRNPADAVAAGCAGRGEYARLRRDELNAALALHGLPPERAWHLGVADQEAARHMAELARTLAALLAGLGPELVVTHPYEGGHPDHDATALAAHAACRLLRGRGLAVPALAEMTSYHAGRSGIVTGEFLPAAEPVITCEMSAAEVEFKGRLLGCYASQRRTLEWFRLDRERFRLAPRYDFTRPPHAGQLFYERFDWGVTGAQWRALAATALAELEGSGAT